MHQPETPPNLRERITRHVVSRITSGEWQAGERIPSETAFMQMFDASRMTVHHALRDLTARGFLVRRSGSGTFVAAPRPYVAEYPHLDIIDEIEHRGGVYRAEVLRRALEPASPELAAAFAVAEGTELFHAVILHRENAAPLEFEDRWILPRALPDCMSIDLARKTLFSHLMLVRPYRQGRETVRAVLAAPAERAALGLADAVPCLEVTRQTWSDEGVVTLARMLRAGGHAAMVGLIRPA